MKANELRIGNWVYSDYNLDKIASIIGIHEGEMACEPIPLTPEILEKADVRQIKKIADFIQIIETQPKFELVEHQDKYTATSTYYWGLEIIGTEVKLKHLHQLQNLYFALTGEELMIDEQELKRSVATKSNSSNEAD